MPYTYRNPYAGGGGAAPGTTVSFDVARPDLVATGRWTLIADNADADAVAAVNKLNAARPAATAADALLTQATANQAAVEAARIGRGAANGLAGLDASGRLAAGLDAGVLATAQPSGSLSSPVLGVLPAPRFRFPSHRDSVISAFQSGYGWTTSGSPTVTQDTTDYVIGTQSVKMVTTGNGATNELRSPTLTAIDLSSSYIILAIKVDDFTHYNDLQLRFSSNGFTDFGYCKPIYSGVSQRWIEPNQWHLITITRASIVAGMSWNNGGMQYSGVQGNVNWAAITGVRIKAVDDAAGTMTIRVNLVGYAPCPTYPALSIVFDDGRATHFSEARAYMDRFRLRGTSAVIVESIDWSNAYMTTAQVKALQQYAGWEVCVHARDNISGNAAHALGYDALTEAAGEADALQAKAWLHSQGLRGVNGICLPHGTWSLNSNGTVGANADVLGTMRKYFDWCRTTYPSTLETYPPASPYKLRSYTVSNTDTAANLLAVLDAGIAAKTWTIMQWHNIVSPASSSTDSTPAVFQAFIDGVVSRISANNLKVRPVGEILQYGVV
jgi:hypothetical protein